MTDAQITQLRSELPRLTARLNRSARTLIHVVEHYAPPDQLRSQTVIEAKEAAAEFEDWVRRAGEA